MQKDIAAAYAKYLKNPQVSVRITERKSRPPATVFGAVRQATRVQMQRKVRLNELMAASGGFTERAAGTIQILHTEPVMCPEPGKKLKRCNRRDQDSLKLVRSHSELASLKRIRLSTRDYILVTEAEPISNTAVLILRRCLHARSLTLGRASQWWEEQERS